MLRLEQISRQFPGVRALQQVSLEFRAGEIHALCGENGAGKSTLMNIIAGNLRPDEGALYWEGNRLGPIDAREARRLGIGIVYQERSLIDTLSVAENLFPDQQPRNRWGFIDYPALYRRAQDLLDRLQVRHLSPRRQVGFLSAAQKQMVEIAKALASEPRLLILDEPTASVSERETQVLFPLLRQLRDQGVAVIYISHRMSEILAIADRVSVLKDGVLQATLPASETHIDELVRLMVGRDLALSEFPSHAQEERVLELEDLSGKGFENIHFALQRGEILGLAGLVGAGRTELALALFGAEPYQSGRLRIRGLPIHPKHPEEAIRLGIAYLPEERKTQGIFPERTVAENIGSSRLLDGGWYRRELQEQTAAQYRESLNIRTPSLMQLAGRLSGGNQQKVVLARWLQRDPEVLIVDEPTHGVDVGAKAELYALLKQMTARGKSILLISSELPELLLLADRIAVMHEGRLRGILSRQEASEEKIMALAVG